MNIKPKFDSRIRLSAFIRVFLIIFILEIIIEIFGYEMLGSWILGFIPQYDPRVFHFFWLLLISSPILFVWVSREMKKQRQQAMELYDKENAFYSLFYFNIEPVFACDLDRRITNVNPAVENMLGYPLDQLVGTDFSLYIDPPFQKRAQDHFLEAVHGHPQEYELSLIHRDGHRLNIIGKCVPIYQNGTIVGIYGIEKDITQQKETEKQMWVWAHQDPLTNLPNRKLFLECLADTLQTADQSHERFAVLFLDLDRFKYINDAMGHEIGDIVLKTVSERMQDCVRSDDLVARFGGDEFAVLLPQFAKMKDVTDIADQIVERIRECIVCDGYEFYLSASIGIAVYPMSDTVQALLKNSDAAMYEAKRLGKNRYQIYMPSINQFTYERMQLENDLRKALQAGEQLYLEYQPQVDVESGEVVSAEALLRWKHPVIGVIPPNEFIPLAEDTGLIHPIGEYVLRSVCKELKVWQQSYNKRIPVSINVSSLELHRTDFVPTLRSILVETDTTPEWIAIEITETTLLKNERETVEKLKMLKEMGIKIYIDDFGKEYSSLSFLKNFPVDVLKIDEIFVREMDTNLEDASIVAAMITLAHSRSLKVIAEGVEREQQLHILAEQRCDEYQGYFCSRPIDPTLFVERFLLLK